MRISVSSFFLHVIVLAATVISLQSFTLATTFEVGDGKSFTKINDVPWESLQAGDTVLIYWRAASYKEKWVINRLGQPNAPITVRGVPGPNGELPVIDGNGATTRTTLNYWNEVRGLIKIGGSSFPTDVTPQYIVIENLDVRSARPPYTFTTAKGDVVTYADNAAAILIEKGDHITLRNCVISDSGNGLFASSSDTVLSSTILVEGCYVHDNGIVDSPYQHNVYTEAKGITFQNNRFGPLRAGAQGSNLKDRSSGQVVRYNWIEGGNRELDLVDGGGCAAIINDPRYHETYVYGNILIEPDGDGNRQIVHYGGDSANTADYRKGTLYFYQNTIVSKRTDRTTLFRLSTNDERCEARNNLFYTVAGGNTLALLDYTGVVQLSHNWLKPGWVISFNVPPAGSVVDDGTSILGAAPGFVNEAGQDYHLALGSATVNTGIALNPIALVANDVTQQYRKHQASEPRPKDKTPDLGAYEQGGTTDPAPAPTPVPLKIVQGTLPGGTTGASYTGTLSATGGTAPYSWAVVTGSLPTGLSLDSPTGTIKGIPTSGGVWSFNVRVTDSKLAVVTFATSVTITTASTASSVPLQVSINDLGIAKAGTSYTQMLTAIGGSPVYTWEVISGSLPPGLTLNGTSGAIMGVPSLSGAFFFTVRVRDTRSITATRYLALIVNR